MQNYFYEKYPCSPYTYKYYLFEGRVYKIINEKIFKERCIMKWNLNIFSLLPSCYKRGGLIKLVIEQETTFPFPERGLYILTLEKGNASDRDWIFKGQKSL